MSQHLNIGSNFSLNEFVYGKGIFDKQYFCNYISEQLFKYLGTNAKKKLIDVVAPEDKQAFEDAFVIADRENTSIYIRILRADGEYRRCKVDISMRNDLLYDILMIDIENICEAYMYNAEALNKVRYVAERQGYIIFEYFYHSDETVIYAFDGEKKAYINDKTYNEIKTRIKDDAKLIKEQENKFAFDQYYTINGSKYAVNGNVILKDSEEYEIAGMIFENAEISMGSIKQKSIHDVATGLFNKPHSFMLARKAINLKKYQQVSLIMIDVDDFKSINDTYGHFFGDEVLKKVAYIIRESAMNRGFAGRFGGDEFFIALYDIGTEGDLSTVLQEIYYNLKASFADKDLNVTCTMGIAEYPRNGYDFDVLMRKADRALYIGKYKGKNRYIIYNEDIHGEMSDNDALTNICANEHIDKGSIMRGVGECLLDLYGVTDGNSNKVSDVLVKLIDLYKMDGISVYKGPDFKKVYEIGTYTLPFDRIEYMNNPHVLAFFSDNGVMHQTINYTRSNSLEELHEEMKNHSIVETTQYMIGDKNHIRGLITYDCERHERYWSQDEIMYITLFSKVLSEIILPQDTDKIETI